MSHNPHVQTLVDSASQNRLAVLFYRKGVTRAKIPPRLIEPYCFVAGKQDLMIRCYQLEHDGDASESGWRFFMSHKIDHAEMTSITYRPRRKVTLPTGELTEEATPNEYWKSDGRRIYRDLLGDALADGRLHPSEIEDLHRVREQHGMTLEDVRFVHASVYQRCLAAVLDDGFITADETEQIRFLHTSLHKLGWAVGE